jgi:Fur family ferric uptake transcriptional regulator
MDYELMTALRAGGNRVTAGRRAVFELLRHNPALTIRELRQRTANQLDTASLYRTLALFRELGMIQDVVIAGQRKVELTDAFSPHHHHIACSRCGTTVTIHDEAFEAQTEALAARHGFTHQSHSFEITGLCSRCRAS